MQNLKNYKQRNLHEKGKQGKKDMTKENTLVEKVGEHHEQRPHLNFSLFRLHQRS